MTLTVTQTKYNTKTNYFKESNMNKTKVLIVEDIAIVAMDLKNRLTRLKFIVTVATLKKLEI